MDVLHLNLLPMKFLFAKELTKISGGSVDLETPKWITEI